MTGTPALQIARFMMDGGTKTVNSRPIYHNKGKTMKKLLISLALIPAFSLQAMPQLTEDQKAYFIKEGLPIPGSGITIAEPAHSAAVSKALAEQTKDGYRHEYSQAATNLLNIDALLAPEIKRIKTLRRQKQSANLSSNLSDITMAYKFNPVPEGVVKRVITYAPTGAYITEGKTEGWLGMTEYFESNFAPCSYEENNLILSGGASTVDRDTITYDVNGKITEYMALGDGTGYLYSVQWTDDTYRRKLRCATKVFSPDFKAKLIALANKIDLG